MLLASNPGFDTRTTLQKAGLVAVADELGSVLVSEKSDVLVPPKMSAAEVRTLANEERAEAVEMNAEFDAARADVSRLAERAVRGELSPAERKTIGHPKPSVKTKLDAEEAAKDLAFRASTVQLTKTEKAELIAKAVAHKTTPEKTVAPKKAAAPKTQAAPKVVLPVIKLEIDKTYRYAGPGPWNDQMVKLLSVTGERAKVSLISKPASKAECKAANLAAA